MMMLQELLDLIDNILKKKDKSNHQKREISKQAKNINLQFLDEYCLFVQGPVTLMAIKQITKTDYNKICGSRKQIGNQSMMHRPKKALAGN